MTQANWPGANKTVSHIRNEIGNDEMNKVLFKHRQPKVVTEYVECNTPAKYDALRAPLFQRLSVRNNTLGKAKLFSADGETVQLYRAMRKGQDLSQCMSWSFNVASAEHFFTMWGHKASGLKWFDFETKEAYWKATNQFVEDNYEFRVMTVPLDLIEDVTLFAPNSEHEVLMNVNCAEFIELFEGCDVLAPSVVKENGYA